MVFRSISLSDLLRVPKFAEAFGKEDKYTINQQLWKHGIDINEPITEEVVTHRNLHLEVVTCLRYVGTERFDKAWLKSPYCTLENFIDSDDDPEMRGTMKSYSSEGLSEHAYNAIAQKYVNDNKLN